MLVDRRSYVVYRMSDVLSGLSALCGYYSSLVVRISYFVLKSKEIEINA